MKNAVLLSVSSELYSFGSSTEAISDVPLQMDNIGNLYGSSFSTQYDQQLGGSFAIPPQCETGPSSLMTIQRLDYPYLGEGYLTTTSNNYDCIINPDQHPFSLTYNLSSVPQYQESEFQTMENRRKRPIEVNDNLVSKFSGVDEWTTKKKKKKASMEFKDQWSYEDKQEGREVHREKVPAKRSQKLSDKITALQKLVSPYGKTDTASVLEEAFSSIKFLQDQIQNLCNMMNPSYTNTQPLHSQKTEEKHLDLRSRGLCLVPLSFCSETEKGRPI